MRVRFAALICAATLSAAEPRWIRITTPDFEIYSTAGERATRETLQHFEQVRSFFQQTLGASDSRKQPVRIVVFGSKKEYEPYRINEFAVAYYLGGAERDYIVLSQAGSETFPVAVHEYAHLVFHHGGPDLPPWLDEGLAELYSTLKPLGKQIVVGNLIPGRMQALVQEKWVPLATILAADRNSPYYNEKAKAGSLYNESWALTHMLALGEDYRPGFRQLLALITSGTKSEEAVVKVYNKPLTRVEKDLQAYLRGDTFHGFAVAVKMEKAGGELAAEDVPPFDQGMMLAELLARPEQQEEAAKKLRALAEAEPTRPETHAALGYAAMRAGKMEEGRAEWKKAIELGERNPKILWDYSRMEAGADRTEAMRVMKMLLEQDATRTDVRLELAWLQLDAQQAKAALITLQPLRKVEPAQAVRLFQVMAYAWHNEGNAVEAVSAAKRFYEVARTPEEKDSAQRLLRALEQRAPSPAAAPAPAVVASRTVDGPPIIRRVETVEAPVQKLPPPRPAAEGLFVELQCLGAQARVVVQTAAGPKAFLIEDPTTISVVGVRGGKADLGCGRQKPVRVRIEYDLPKATQRGVEGLIRTIYFEP